MATLLERQAIDSTHFVEYFQLQKLMVGKQSEVHNTKREYKSLQILLVSVICKQLKCKHIILSCVLTDMTKTIHMQ